MIYLRYIYLLWYTHFSWTNSLYRYLLFFPIAAAFCQQSAGHVHQKQPARCCGKGLPCEPQTAGDAGDAKLCAKLPKKGWRAVVTGNCQLEFEQCDVKIR